MISHWLSNRYIPQKCLPNTTCRPSLQTRCVTPGNNLPGVATKTSCHLPKSGSSSKGVCDCAATPPKTTPGRWPNWLGQLWRDWKERIDCLCRLVNRTCTESGLIIMFIIILVITIIILILMSHQTGFLTKPENFLVTTTQVFRLHVVDLHRLCDRKIAAPPATLVTLDESLGVEAGGRLRNVVVIDIYPLLNLQKWPCIEQALFFDPMAKMAKNHPANASSREIIKAHMAQWSCHVARTSYHLCFEGSKNPLPKHRMRAGWEFVVSLS